jgi:hypothetical protein
MPAYKRILLKLSGEALMGDDAYGINRATIVRMVREVREVTDLGVAAATSSVAWLAARSAWTAPPPTTWACSPP